jgi:hypothetical protein
MYASVSSLQATAQTWAPVTPPYLEAASQQLRRLQRLQLARAYRATLPAPLKAQLAQKLAASELFAARKALYPQSIAPWFRDDRLAPPLAAHPLRPRFDALLAGHPDDTRVRYAAVATKFDRTSYKARPRVVVVTNQSLFFLEPASFALVYRLDFKHVTGLSLSKHYDSLLVVHTDGTQKGDKGDFVLRFEHVVEAAMKISLAAQKVRHVRITDTIAHARRGRAAGHIVFIIGYVLLVGGVVASAVCADLCLIL